MSYFCTTSLTLEKLLKTCLYVKDKSLMGILDNFKAIISVFI